MIIVGLRMNLVVKSDIVSEFPSFGGTVPNYSLRPIVYGPAKCLFMLSFDRVLLLLV